MQNGKTLSDKSYICIFYDMTNKSHENFSSLVGAFYKKLKNETIGSVIFFYYLFGFP